MDRARNQFFARASFTEDADTRLARRDTLDLRQQFRHGLAGTY